MTERLHDDELSLDPARVRQLVDARLPQHAHLPLRPVRAHGSTNVLFRLGDGFCVRLPRQRGGGALIEKEARWLPVIGPALPVAVPEVVALGAATDGFPESWSIVRWLGGEHPPTCSPTDSPGPGRTQLAADLADVVLSLRASAPPEPPVDADLRTYRGESLAGFDRDTRRNVERCRSIEGLDLDLDAALDVWTDSLELAAASDAERTRWYHGDLVAENLLVRGGRLTGVLDFGGLGIGDPSIDLHGAWELFDASARDAFRARLGVDDAEWLRGRAWALAIALAALPYYWASMPGRVRDRQAMARSVLADARGETASPGR